jgi:quinone-reactive Ni/Fe-hydrogenase large subunit
MSKKIVIDPVTRIEGHLRIEAEVNDEGVVTEAWASGQLFRGIETIIKGRDPRDTGLIAARICGVCTNVHYRASISAVEDAYQITIPQNARLIRDLVTLSLFVQDHVVHYYHLHSFDYVDMPLAIQADPGKALELATRYHPQPYHLSTGHLEAVKEKLQSYINAGRLGIFSNGYWGHAAYKLSPEACLIHASHYLTALRIQRELGKAVAIFGGKTPHPQNLVVGGVTSVMDMLNPQRVNDFLFIIKEAREFIERAYLPDMKMLCDAYRAEIEAGDGRSAGHFMTSGGYSFGPNGKLFESGVILDHDFEQLHPFDEAQITEDVTRAWYAGQSIQTPYEGETEVCYTDLHPDGTLKSEEKYSWIKAPRYEGYAMETGPLARMLVGYCKDSETIKPYMQSFMDATGLKLIDFNTSVGRNAARAIEAQICVNLLFAFGSDMIENIKYYDEETWTHYTFESLPTEAQGRGIFEVPRGMLAHYVRIEEAKVVNYQVVVPTTWNASPKDSTGIRGPYEEAIVGLKLANPNEPLEILRVVHSYDPCIACAVHVVDASGCSLADYKMDLVCQA